MARYILRDDLSCCRIGEQLVLLDVSNDRYFRLPHSMEQALAAHLEGDGNPEPDISELVERKILVVQVTTAIGGRPSIKSAVRSAMEASRPKRKLRLLDLLEVTATVLYTRLELKLSTLKYVLGRLTADRKIQTAQAKLPQEVFEHRLTDAAALYRCARLYVPVKMRCLLDSVAMARFLRRRQLHAHVVFGVALDPFSAHCWVQSDDLVLNDTVGNVISHTPIRVL